MGLLTKASQFIAARALSLLEPRLHAWFSAPNSFAGRHVNVDAALQISTAFACARLNATTFGTLPVIVQEKRGDTWVAAGDHPLQSLLNDAPNADMDATAFWSAMGMMVQLRGNAYAEISRVRVGNGPARVVALTPLMGEVSIERQPGGALVYKHHPLGGETPRMLDEDAVLHLKGTTLDGIVGLSPIALARHTLGLALSAEEATGALYRNGLRSRGYLSTPASLTPQQRTDLRSYMAELSGSENAGSIPVLPGGMKFESIMMQPMEAELLATRSFTVDEICRFFGTPPQMIGHMEKATAWGTGLEILMLGYYQTTLRPLLSNAEGATRLRLLTPAERGRVRIKWNYEGLLRADSKGRAEYLRLLVEAGIITANEARSKAMEGLGPLPGGDQLTIQSNRVPAPRLGEATSTRDLPPIQPQQPPNRSVANARP